jgi:ribosome biogenesis GTPase
MTLESLGWSTFFANGFARYIEQGYSAGRVALEHKNRYQIFSESGQMWGEISGRMRHDAAGRDAFPAVGDWVAMSTGPGGTPGGAPGGTQAIIHAVLPRRSKFSRKAPGAVTEEQIVAANVDTVFLVTGLDDNFNVRRIERYLTLAWESGASPVVVLNKADLRADVEACVAETESVAFGAPVIAVSAAGGEGIERLRELIGPGRTAALMGSSGVGKSTITNALAGEQVMDAGSVSDSVGKGRHTTTHRELIPLPDGGLLIDTPGMRELQLWGGDEGLHETFEDVEELAARCRFGDCRHEGEPGCAIAEAIDNGTLDERRFGNYQKLQRELAYFNRRHDKSLMAAEKKKWKQIHVQMKDRPIKRR